MSLSLNYQKRKNQELFSTFEKELELYNIQNYIPIYDRFFNLSEKNYNDINLNHPTYIHKIRKYNKDDNEFVFRHTVLPCEVTTSTSVRIRGIIGSFLFQVAVNKVASSRKKNDFKHTDTSAAPHAAANSTTGSGKTAEQHAPQHTPHHSTSHTPHKPATGRLL